MINFLHKEKYNLEDLIEIMRILRSPQGCPWDREQTHQSIRMNFIEETYEACEAIDNGDTDLLKEELGDVLAQVVFHSLMEEEAGNFDINDVADGVCKKFIERHPHIFGDVTVRNSDQVLANWDDIKRTQKGHDTHFKAMDSVARSLPALMRAEKLQAKARKAGFDWPDVEGAFDKIAEETREVREAIRSGGVAEEVGDLLFAVVNVARFLKVNPEQALDAANEKFLRRFGAMERLSKQGDKPLEQMDLSEMDKLWEKVKQLEKDEGEKEN